MHRGASPPYPFPSSQEQTIRGGEICGYHEKRFQTDGFGPGIGTGSLHITTPFDLDELRSAGLPVVIDFGADSCIPCKEMAPVLVELHKSLQGKAIIRFVDVWKYRDLAEGYPLQVIPTQVLFGSDGKPFVPDESTQIPFNQYGLKTNGEHVFTTHEG